MYGAVRTADGNYVLMEPLGFVVSEEDGGVYIGFQGTSVPDDVALALDGVDDEDEDEDDGDEDDGDEDQDSPQKEQMRGILRRRHRSRPNIYNAARSLQGLPHDEFGTLKVASTSESCVRKIRRETGLALPQIEAFAHEQEA